MKELMIHVERIVKPVVATQGRKLRMRMELLAHLQATLDEERHRSAGDERIAIEHAKLRLGDSVELTRNLQQTVPIVERILLAKLPVSHHLDYLERRLTSHAWKAARRDDAWTQNDPYRTGPIEFRTPLNVYVQCCHNLGHAIQTFRRVPRWWTDRRTNAPSRVLPFRICGRHFR